ncbi:MAG: hypothetical protein WD336_03750 [Trueperaceae bacterium]
MRKRLQKIGTSRALVVTKDMMGLMGVEGDENEVDVHMVGPVLVVTKPGLSAEEMRIAAALMRVMDEDAELLERLAE